MDFLYERFFLGNTIIRILYLFDICQISLKLLTAIKVNLFEGVLEIDEFPLQLYQVIIDLG
jgi:hypothetical protein